MEDKGKMSKEIEADYDQMLLLPRCVEEWVGRDHPARFIREVVAAHDLKQLGISWGSESLNGTPHYSAEVLLRVWVYGYYIRIRSSRALESACRNHMAMIWLCGNLAPDHNTLWRFFKANRVALRKLFRSSVKLAVKSDLVGMVLHALDGTKIPAHSSGRSGLHRAALDKRLKRVEEDIARIEEEIEKAHTDSPQMSDALPERLHNAEALRQSIRQGLKELDEAGEDHVHPAEPDARVMKCQDRNRNVFAYNNQAVVDEKSRLIVAEFTTTHEADTNLLAPMLGVVQEELGVCAKTTVADAGYACSQQFHAVEEAGQTALVNLPSRLKPDAENQLAASNFRYDEANNQVICPLGQTLEYTHTRWHSGKNENLRCFRCRHKDCPLRSQCSKDPKGRKIELGAHYEALQRQRDVHKHPDSKPTLAKRCWIVEPVFGWIKQQLGFRRFTMRGIQNAQAQWTLICTTYNLRVLYALWRAGNLKISQERPVIATC